jgi:hypothetical protein
VADLVLQASNDLVARLAHEADPVPAVVKLVWNAIDAEASSMTVLLERHGTTGTITQCTSRTMATGSAQTRW